jgi:hypothetical protein
MVAPLSSESPSFARSQVTNGIRQVTTITSFLIQNKSNEIRQLRETKF